MSHEKRTRAPLAAELAADRARQRLDELREEILVGVKRRVRECLGPQPPSIARYYRAYVRSFDVPFEPCGLAEVVRAASAAKIVYVGDFHTNPAAQRAELDLLEKVVRAGRRPVLAVEMFAREDARTVDRFQSGELSEREFLRAIRYEQSWGFRWENYRELLGAARRFGVRVVPANCKRNVALPARDRISAEAIAPLLSAAREPEEMVFVVYGDLHLAAGHLPAEVARLAGGRDHPKAIVFQNSETIWRRLGSPAASTAAARLDGERFCLLNTPPLVKMQGYLSWLESSSVQGGEPGPLGLTPRYVDPDDLAEELEGIVDSLASFFGLPAPSLDDWELHVLDDLGFAGELADRRSTAPWARLIRERRPVVVSDPPLVYLPDVELVTAAGAAAAIIARAASGDLRPALLSRGAFHRRIVDRALEWFAAKLVHPALAATGPNELLRLLERAGDAPIPRKLRRRVEVARRLPPWLESIEAGVAPEPSRTDALREADIRLGFDLSRAAGEWIGDSLFRAYERGRISISDLREALRTTWTEPAAERATLEWGALAQS
jgi:hypothetical protein